MTSDRPTKDSRQRLFVEGADDFHVICALVRKSGVKWTARDPRIPFAPNTNGDVNAISQALVALKSLTHPRVGLVVDADTNPSQRWEQINRQLQAFGASLPDDHRNGAVVALQGGHRVGVWMMPHGGHPGAIESLVASLVPDSSLKEHADVATQQAREQHGANFEDKDLEKARLRTWLAWQKAPGAPYGRAIDAGYLLASSGAADALVRWFHELYME